MKQRISKQQLEELTEEQMKIVSEWWIPQNGDLFVTNSNDNQVLSVREVTWEGYIIDWENGETYEKDDVLPLLTIGQIFELIQERGRLKFGKLIDIGYETLPLSLNQHYMLDLVELSSRRKIDFRGYTDELCDLLWEGLKEAI